MTSPSYSKMKWIYLITLVIAACSILYELIIAKTLSLLTDDIVLWQSVTIGIYIAALGLGTWLSEKVRKKDLRVTFFHVELSLAALGAFSVLFIYCFYFLYRSFLYEDQGGMVAYLGLHSTLKDQFGFYLTAKYALFYFGIVSQLITVAVGVLSGFEIPFLIRLSEDQNAPNATSKILAIHYFGTLLGTLGFVLWLAPKLSLFQIALFTGILNSLAAFLLWWILKEGRIWKLVPVFIFLLIGYFSAGSIEQMHLKTFYQIKGNMVWSEIMKTLTNERKIKRVRSDYQVIDRVPLPQILRERFKDPGGFILHLNGHYQLATHHVATYHRPFVQIPLIVFNQKPKKVLVLGGGDGILVSEVLKQVPDVQKITLVELDPEMTRLARIGKLSTLNQNALDHPKVQVIHNDAFQFLRHQSEKFDAIFMDFPTPFNFDLSKLYSVEMFEGVKRALQPKGVLTFDFPIRSPRIKGSIKPDVNQIIAATLLKAGFKEIHSFGLLDHYVTATLHTPIIHKQVFRQLIPTDYQSYTHFQKIVTSLKESQYFDPRVNSIFRPTLIRLKDPVF